MLGWRPCKGRSDQRFLQGDLIQIHVWGQIDRDLTYPTKKGKGKSSSSKVPWDRICYILREYPIHFLSHPKIWVETAETAIGHWWQPSEAAKHQPFPAQVWGCDREVAEQLDNLILGSWSASRIQHKGHQYVKSWRKKLGDLYFNPVIQTRIVNDSLHLHLYATHGFSNVWCSCLGCLQSFHCLGIFKWMLLLANQPSLTVEDEAWASTCCNPLGTTVVQRKTVDLHSLKLTAKAPENRPSQ